MDVRSYTGLEQYGRRLSNPKFTAKPKMAESSGKRGKSDHGKNSGKQQRSRAAPESLSHPINTIFQFKLVLLGEAAVGKSSLVLRFVKGHYYEHQESTIGAAFLTQSIALDNTTVKFEIWDTAGQERYHSLAPMYYRGAQASIVVYDITSPDSYQRAKTWVRELQRQAAPNIVIALAGNKADLGAQRQVENEEGAKYASENGLIFMETSAKTSQNVIEVFTAIARKLPKSVTNPERRNADAIQITAASHEEKKKKCC